MHPTNFLGRERIRASLRVNSGPEQRLVDVDVPQSANESLIEKNGLDLSWTPPQPLFQPRCRKTALEWLATQPLIETVEIITVDVEDPAELALVREAQVESIVELDREMLEAKRRFLTRNRAQSSGHPQVDDDRGAIVEINKQVLGAPANALDSTPVDTGKNILGALVAEDSREFAEPQ